MSVWEATLVPNATLRGVLQLLLRTPLEDRGHPRTYLGTLQADSE